MAVSEHASGTFSPGATSSSWTTLTANPETTDAAVQVVVDANALAVGDTLDVRLIEKAISGGTARQAWAASVSGPQTSPLLVSPAMFCLHGWDVQVRQTAGTVRSFPWSVRKAT